MRQSSENRLEYALERMAAGTLHTGDPQLARAAIDDWLTSGEADARAWEALTAASIGYLDAMRDAGISGEQLDTAVRWVLNHLDPDQLGPVAGVARLGRSPEDQQPPIDRRSLELLLQEVLGDNFMPAIAWLLAGLVETSGASDVGWLKQFRPVR